MLLPYWLPSWLSWLGDRLGELQGPGLSDSEPILLSYCPVSWLPWLLWLEATDGLWVFDLCLVGDPLEEGRLWEDGDPLHEAGFGFLILGGDSLKDVGLGQ